MSSRARVNPKADTQQLAEDIRRASSQVPQNVVYTSGRFTAQIGQVNRVRGTVLMLLPPADQASAGGETTVLLEGGTLTVACPNGTVNALASLVFSVPGAATFKSTGKGGWLLVGLTANGSIPNALLAPMPANTVKANATGLAAPPQDFPLNNNELLGRAGGSITAIGVTTQAVVGRQGANLTDIDSVASTWLGRDGGGDLDFYPPVGGGRASLSAPVSATASASSFAGPSFTIPANTLAVGQVWRATAWYRFSRGATATALNINCRLRVAADLVEAFVVSNTAAGEYQGRVEVCFTVASIGAGGTAYGSAWLDHMLGRTTVLPGTQAAHNGGANVETATVAIDTTVANSFQLRMAMTAAVAATTLTMTHGVIERVF